MVQPTIAVCDLQKCGVSLGHRDAVGPPRKKLLGLRNLDLKTKQTIVLLNDEELIVSISVVVSRLM